MPSDQIPDPLRGLEIGTFTHYSIIVRLPDIARRVLQENAFPPQITRELEILIAEIPDAPVRKLGENAPDVVSWNKHILPYLGQDWLEVPWFFIETYFFRRILEATGYYQTGPGHLVDPYRHQKKQGLISTLNRTRELASQLQNHFAYKHWDQTAFADLLAGDLWGNQADLSLWPAEEGEKPDHLSLSQANKHLLVNDTPDISTFIEKATTAMNVHFIIDNAGYELVGDLTLTDYLLTTQTAAQVHFHVKPHPTYVSDATQLDVLETIKTLGKDKHPETHRLGARLQNHLDERRLTLGTHYFWTSPLAAWDLPSDLSAELSQADLVISKGDANYRRLLGDRHWPATAPFAEITSYFPTAMAALRTCKSETICCLLPGQAAALTAQDAEWQTNGRWGMILFRD